MNAEDRIERTRTLYDQAVLGGDASALTDADRDLDGVEADTALARGRILHARFLIARASSGSPAVEDPAELPLFERAIELYEALGDVRGQAETSFWIGCLHQVIRGDNETAVPHLERSREMAAQVGDKTTQAEALRHLGIAAHAASRLDEARERLEESSRLRREQGALGSVAANMVGLAYVAAAQDRHEDALATLDRADALAQAHGAHAIVRQIEHARTQI
ncbi:tetratricopeptide repeat protein [Micromonospora sp. NPDC085948]|uniref:tetratricopeptide repeat protein n=1 Tax=Micromonospora sp. NPDC085948 TaxID=3155293 RepID=UPI0034184BBA